MSKFQNDAIFWVDVDKIDPNPYQPRRDFNEDGLRDLAESIRQYGVLQPLTVTRNEETKPDGGLKVYYELIAGERRLRAAKMANLSQVPVTIRDEKEDAEVKLELAIIENLQREDLNPIERAEAFNQLSDEFDFTHKEIAEKIGKSREYVSNSMRLLKLPEKIKQAVMSGKIAEGHARPVLMLRDNPEKQQQLFKEIIHQDLTVREAEKRARRDAQDKVRKKENKIDPETKALEDELSDTLGTRVQIEKKDKGGKLVIDFFSDEDLQGLIEMVNQNDEASVDEVMKEYAKAINGDVEAENEAKAQTSTPEQESEKEKDEPAETSSNDSNSKEGQQSAVSENQESQTPDNTENQSMAETLGTMIQQAREQKEAADDTTKDKPDETEQSIEAEATVESKRDSDDATETSKTRLNQQSPTNQVSDQKDTDSQHSSEMGQHKQDSSTTKNKQEDGNREVKKSQDDQAQTPNQNEEVADEQEIKTKKTQAAPGSATVNEMSAEKETVYENKQEQAIANPSAAIDKKQPLKEGGAQSTNDSKPDQEGGNESDSSQTDNQETDTGRPANQEPVSSEDSQDKPTEDAFSNHNEDQSSEPLPDDDADDEDEEDDMYSVSNFSI